ncbi:hypothetical protein JD78_02676 [Modestobacter roseus]|uniref:Uncharacterized protein n=1 Tax=Modestobacter roseus TaxID=1181884 RepID=A0A562ISZ9_9ACTN|nr:hypothetical protein JD78_02676 [Modestobacter roseus]
MESCRRPWSADAVACLLTDGRNGATVLKKVLTWVAIAFVVFYVIQRPEDAAGIVRSAGGALSDAAQSLSAFVGSLV